MIEAVRGMGSRPLLLTLPTVVKPDMTVEDLERAGVMFPYFQSAYGVGDLLDLIEAYNRVIRRVAAQEGVPLVELSHRFEEIEDTPRYFIDTMHLSPFGMQIVASELLAGLERNRLLGPAQPGDPSGDHHAASAGPGVAK
jgi:hypothetical protein